MSNKKTSSYISLVLCIISLTALAALVFVFPAFFEYLIANGNEPSEAMRAVIRNVSIAFYICAPFVAAALVTLILMLINIIKNKVFVTANVRFLALLSLCCYVVMIITGIFTYYYTSLLFVALIMGVTATLLLVVKNMMQSAVTIKNENDLTI